MGRFKNSGFLDRVYTLLPRELGDGYLVDRLWVEWRGNWSMIVRVGEYLPYLESIHALAIEVVEPYWLFRVVGKKNSVYVGQTDLARLIVNQYKVKKEWGLKVERRDDGSRNRAGFIQRNNWFSDFHYKHCPSWARMFDLDIVVVRCDRIVGVYDLKWGFDEGTEFEKLGYRMVERRFGIQVKEIRAECPEDAVSQIAADVFVSEVLEV